MNRPHGFTRIELLSIVGALVIFGSLAIAVILPALSVGHKRPHWPRCISNLKQLALAERMFMNEHDDVPSWMLSTNQGGSREYRESRDVWRHFQVLSNEVSIPKILHCRADKERQPARDWVTLRNGNVSYFINLNAHWSTNHEINSATMLFGDRLIDFQKGHQETNFLFTADQRMAWKPQIHSRQGSIAFADGSVQGFTTKELQNLIQSAEAKRAQTTNPPPLLALP